MTKQYLAVVGNIGSGKTALADLLSKHFGWTLVPESIAENPYLSDAYKNLDDHAFKLQVYYLGSRSKQHLISKKTKNTTIQDRAIYEDSEVFAKTYYELGAYSSVDYQNLLDMYGVLKEILPTPDIFIYTHCPVSQLISNIKRRERAFETTLDKNVLEKLQENYNHWIDNQEISRSVKIDSSRYNFVDNQEDKMIVIDMIKKELI